MSQVVILAGGLATRLGDLTRETPKALLPVAGRPFLAWQLGRHARSGYDDALLLTGYLGDAIAAFVGDGSAFGLRARVLGDGPELLGTAGALRHALDALDDEFLVTYGDSYLPFDYSGPLVDLRSHAGALGTMSVFHNAGRWDASNTLVRGDTVVRYEKGSTDPELDHIDYGAIALRRSVVAELPAGERRGLDAIQTDLARRGVLRAYLATRRFYEIGSPAGLAELDRLLSEGEPE
ncbi:MAG TPA: sugar phosphate nucleotidyltransferase [Polyangiaceae bacterium]